MKQAGILNEDWLLREILRIVLLSRSPFYDRTSRSHPALYIFLTCGLVRPCGEMVAEPVTTLAAAELLSRQLFLHMCVKHGQDFIGG